MTSNEFDNLKEGDLVTTPSGSAIVVNKNFGNIFRKSRFINSIDNVLIVFYPFGHNKKRYTAYLSKDGTLKNCKVTKAKNA